MRQESTAVAKEICESEGFSFDSFERVRSGVYKGTVQKKSFGNSQVVFIKKIDVSTSENIAKFAEIATEVGHPKCQRIVADDDVYLVMGVAPGRPLSQLLPLAFIPGVWSIKREQYTNVYEQIGANLGTLHAKTAGKSGPLFEPEEKDRALALTEKLDSELGRDILDQIQNIIMNYWDMNSIYAMTYGDQTPHNLYYDGTTVTHIDSDCRIRPVIAEHVGPLVGAKMMVERVPYRRSATYQTLSTAYWDGYMSTFSQFEFQPNQVFTRMVYNYLKLVEYYTDGPTSLNGKLTKNVDMLLLPDIIADTVNEISI